MISWETIAEKVGRIYGVHVDMEERFFECPCDCGEPIYEDDYPEFEKTESGYICPISEEEVELD